MRCAILNDLQIGFPIAVKQLVSDFAGRVLVAEFNGARAEPLDRNDRDDRVRENARTEQFGLRFSSLASAVPLVSLLPASLRRAGQRL